ncbi:MAG TPA: hypothetical protein VJ604_18745 [Geomonas sp.]|nr:hypothetical protein [Geomonas sp.]
MKLSNIVLPVAEYACIAGAVFTAYKADGAMNKAGIGNLELFAFWSRCTWLIVTIFLLLWMLAVVLAVVNQQRRYFARPLEYWISLVPTVLLPPALLVVFWLAYLVWM